MKLENAEPNLLVQKNSARLYVLTGPSFERLMRPLPNAPPTVRLLEGHGQGRRLATGFIMDQALQREADYCGQRVPLIPIELRARLDFLSDKYVGNIVLDNEIGCNEPRPERPAPDQIPK